MNDVFGAILFEGDWFCDEYNKAIINYLVIETGYDINLVRAYIDASNEFQAFEISYYCNCNSLEGELDYVGFINSKTSLSIEDIRRIMEKENEFYDYLQDSYMKIDQMLIA